MRPIAEVGYRRAHRAVGALAIPHIRVLSVMRTHPPSLPAPSPFPSRPFPSRSVVSVGSTTSIRRSKRVTGPARRMPCWYVVLLDDRTRVHAFSHARALRAVGSALRTHSLKCDCRWRLKRSGATRGPRSPSFFRCVSSCVCLSHVFVTRFYRRGLSFVNTTQTLI